MAKTVSYGHDRRSKVPGLPGTVAKLCGHCDKFFAARGKERVCDGCVSEPERLRRNQRAYYQDLSGKGSERPSQGLAGSFSRTHPTTRKRRNSPQAPQVRGTVSDDGAMCRELALELAATIDLDKPKGARGRPAGELRPITRRMARQLTARNVELGLQGRCDLDRSTAA